MRVQRIAVWAASLAAISTLSLSSCTTVIGDWKRATKTNTMAGYHQFRDKHPSSEFYDKALEKIVELEWEGALKENTPEAYRTFLRAHPTSPFVDAALEKVKARKLLKEHVDIFIMNVSYKDISLGTSLPVRQRQNDIILKGEERASLYLKHAGIDMQFIRGKAVPKLSYAKGSLLVLESGRFCIYDARDWWEVQ